MINSVIDISHHNGNRIDFAKVKVAGIVGVIHKATQGLTGVDPMFAENKQPILDAGLLLGAYHFGTGADGADQADHFLGAVGHDISLLVLDYEPNPTGNTMTSLECEDFLSHVSEASKGSPVLYSGAAMSKPTASVSTHVPLWWAQYNSSPSRAWRPWTLWQYTDKALVDGIGHCDRSWFNGTEEQLREWWANPQ